jgi:hypothetical protein
MNDIRNSRLTGPTGPTISSLINNAAGANGPAGASTTTSEITLVIKIQPDKEKRYKIMDETQLISDIVDLTSCSWADGASITNRIIDEFEFYLNSTDYDINMFKNRIIDEFEKGTINDFNSLYHLLKGFTTEIEESTTSNMNVRWK